MDYAIARKRVGLTQAQVAEIIGVDQSTVALWEAGKTAPRVYYLPKIAHLYGCTVDDLLGGQKSTEDQTQE